MPEELVDVDAVVDHAAGWHLVDARTAGNELPYRELVADLEADAGVRCHGHRHVVSGVRLDGELVAGEVGLEDRVLRGVPEVDQHFGLAQGGVVQRVDADVLRRQDRGQDVVRSVVG